jgi:hypothetical protein|tara:strand:- start:1526 stop:3370 length:1845 start_codon:yes stop_codon:yes gene_type:complete
MRKLLTILFILTCNIIYAQCPPNAWGLDITVNPDQYPEETTWHLVTFSGDTLLEGGPYTNIVDYEPQYAGICLPVDSFLFILNDQYGDGIAGSLWGGNDGSVYIEQCGDTIWQLDTPDFGYQIFDTIYTSGCPPPPPVFGCMDSSYVEFDLAATADTGMCYTPKIYGCTDSLAYNYVDSANTEIAVDSCMHELELTDLAGNGWAGSTLKLSQATSMIPPFNYQDIGTYTLVDGFDTTFFINLAAGYPVKAVFEITQQSDFTAVQCGYSLYSEDYVSIDIEGGFVNPIPPFFPITGEPYCGNNCIERTYGCIDTLAVNYNNSVNTDDGSCYYNPGCTNPLYLEYDAAYDYDDNSCATLIAYGCMDSTAFNYDPLANVEIPGSCIAVVEGCMDDGAFNYNPNANVDNGSCIPLIFGCIDPTAFNYCDTCNTDNGSCIPTINGCTDSTAINYDQLANTDNGSCIYPIYGCNDPSAINYDPLVNVPDSTCEYSAGCFVGDIYTLPNDCFSWVIEIDEYCCDVSWDNTCVELYTYCQDGWSGPTDLIEFRNDIVTYPNPTSDNIYVSKKVDLTVISMLGNVMIRKEGVNSLDVSSLTPGVYNILIEYNKIKINKRIIKK